MLVDIELTSVIPPQVIEAVLAASVVQRHRKGDVIFHEGDEAHSMYVVRSGHLAARIGTASGHDVTLAVFGPGHVVGEMALILAGSRRGATVLALDAAETFVLTASAFGGLRARHPDMDRAMNLVLLSRVTRLNRQLRDALYVEVEHRIPRRLLDLASAYGGLRAGLRLPITQQDLAELAGTTRPTVNMVLQRLEASGSIRLYRGGLEVLRPDLLTELAGVD